MKTWILLLIFVFPIIGISHNVDEELRKEFHALATHSLEQLLNHSSHLAPYLTLTFRLVDCRYATALPRIFENFKQTILEEDTYATWRMRQWCAPNPAKTALMMVKSENRSAIADFQCRFEKPLEKYNYHRVFLKRSVNILVFIMISGMCFSWYLTCRRPAPIHPSKILNLPANTEESDSFENVTFNSTTQNRSRISVANRSNYSARPKKFRIIV